MTNENTRAALEAACARAVDGMLVEDGLGPIGSTRSASDSHVVWIRTVESEQREARAVEALRAELARQTGIAVDHCERADAAERMVCEVKAAAEAVQAEYLDHARAPDTPLGRLDAALASTAEVAGRWVSAGVAAGIAKRCDAAIAARDEAVREMHSSESAARMLGDDFARVLRDCTAAERARDEVGIQLAAAQAEIARLTKGLRDVEGFMLREWRPPAEAVLAMVREVAAGGPSVPGDALAPVAKPGEIVVDERGGRTMTGDGLPFDASTARRAFQCVNDARPEVWQAYYAEDEGDKDATVLPDADAARAFVTAPVNPDKFTAALEASGIDSDNVKGGRPEEGVCGACRSPVSAGCLCPPMTDASNVKGGE